MISRATPAITQELVPGDMAVHVEGPAVLELDGSTCWIPPGWVGDRDGNSTLILARV